MQVASGDMFCWNILKGNSLASIWVYHGLSENRAPQFPKDKGFCNLRFLQNLDNFLYHVWTTQISYSYYSLYIPLWSHKGYLDVITCYHCCWLDLPWKFTEYITISGPAYWFHIADYYIISYHIHSDPILIISHDVPLFYMLRCSPSPKFVALTSSFVWTYPFGGCPIMITVMMMLILIQYIYIYTGLAKYHDDLVYIE